MKISDLGLPDFFRELKDAFLGFLIIFGGAIAIVQIIHWLGQ